MTPKALLTAFMPTTMMRIRSAVAAKRASAPMRALPPKTADQTLVTRPGLIAHDADWQHPAVTEHHAFTQMRRLLPPQRKGGDTVYLGFPWATLIDLKQFADHRADKIAALESALAGLAEAAAPYPRVITVCQHINMRHFAPLLQAAGVTDVYWSHAVKGQPRLPEAPQIAVHPFPLFPVQQSTPLGPGQRSILYSFVGARATPYYMTQVRRWIVTQLADNPNGHVSERQTWHYAKAVYDDQIRDQAGAGAPLVDQTASEDFRDIMARSVFALCPSGTGPNSIRLWEAVQAGTIPVVLADTYAPPGPGWLWQAATVRCRETPGAVARLPARLARLAADPQRITLYQRALAVLAQTYGPDRFVHDILTRFDVAGDTQAKAIADATAILRRDLLADQSLARIWARLWPKP
ncbi:exostosin family protein [Loktanella sp. R86503]|uniref:exostosin domain-containing protein n=1 Tax=Loktanella sp. R86503 TaxID=3093847 RepID=UPI0036DF48CC